jgi:succinate dehydrogenase / fumarate reductase cytochrome b subunit
MHGWLHNDYWMNNLAKPLYGGQFDPHHATSSVGMALAPFTARVAYAIGVAACVYHFANGLWTMGITWGIWETAAAQRRANWVCSGIGIFIFVVGMAALFGAVRAGEKDNLLKAEAYEQAKDDAEHRFEEDYKARLEQEKTPGKSAEVKPAEKPPSDEPIPPMAQSTARP